MNREKAKSQTRGKHPVSGRVSDPAPKTRVERNVLPWRLPDHAEERGIIGSIFFDALSIHFPDQS
jgi:hypothetical protein